MARVKMRDSTVINMRIEQEFYNRLKDIAAAESLIRDTHLPVSELIRNAVEFVYTDNERLRECFKRSRAKNNREIPWK